MNYLDIQRSFRTLLDQSKPTGRQATSLGRVGVAAPEESPGGEVQALIGLLGPIKRTPEHSALVGVHYDGRNDKPYLDVQGSFMARLKESGPRGRQATSLGRIGIAAPQISRGDFVPIGFANEEFRSRDINNSLELSYVDMNSSARANLRPGENGMLETSALAGCYGVAALEESPDGELRILLGHFDPLSQNPQFRPQDYRPMRGFEYMRKRSALVDALYGLNDKPLQPGVTRSYFIAYDKSLENDSLFGEKRGGRFEAQHPVTQVHTTLGCDSFSDSHVAVIPYDGLGSANGHILQAGRHEGEAGIFWDGQKIDFSAGVEEGEISD